MLIFLDAAIESKDSFAKIDVGSLVSIFTAIIATISTYIVTKFNIYKPAKLKVSQLQFEKVYLPLYKLLCTSNMANLDKKTALKYSYKMRTILQNNYELAFPQLHQLHNELLNLIISNGEYQKKLNKIIYQVSLDYEILKKKLGYPSLSTYKIFKRKPKKERYLTIVGYVLVFYLMPGLPILVTLLGYSLLLIPCLFLYFVGFFMLIYISKTIDKSMD